MLTVEGKIRIPNSEKFALTLFNENGEDGKKPILVGSASFRCRYKKDSEQYHPETTLPFKAWGDVAIAIYQQCPRGTILNIEGILQQEEDYTDKEGEKRRSPLYININKAYKEIYLQKENTESTEQKKETSPAPKENSLRAKLNKIRS